MSNPFQNFNDAMARVLRGGKAWRESFPKNIKVVAEENHGNIVNECVYWKDIVLEINGKLESQRHYRMNDRDLTATDWVWSESGEEAS